MGLKPIAVGYVHLHWFAAMQKRFFFFIFCLFNLSSLAQGQRPFLHHADYFNGVIRPDQHSQKQLDEEVSEFYLQWKNHYMKAVPGKAEYYVWFEEKEDKQCVSEGQGYGMMITALMARYDTSAKTTFDRLLRYYHAHPTARSAYLMAWAQKKNGHDLDKTSATDGDMDIAYSLLLADKLWGSKGAIDYLAAAKNMIGAIMDFEINHQTWSVLLSDAVESESKDYFDTRSSDFMPAHFRAFAAATGDQRWLKVIDSEYKLFLNFEEKYSPDAGLVSDFIVGLNKTPKPAPPYFLESRYDGCYNYNACRVPWRIATDYLINGDARAKTICDRINRWIRSTTNNNTYNLSAGYTLAGNDLKGRYYEAMSFSGPFAVSAMVDKGNQQWLNQLWDYLVAFKMKDYDYYDNTIKLLDMMIISGHLTVD
jgi:endo-1,4-beta-D-glucanase Y